MLFWSIFSCCRIVHPCLLFRFRRLCNPCTFSNCLYICRFFNVVTKHFFVLKMNRGIEPRTPRWKSGVHTTRPQRQIQWMGWISFYMNMFLLNEINLKCGPHMNSATVQCPPIFYWLLMKYNEEDLLKISLKNLHPFKSSKSPFFQKWP